MRDPTPLLKEIVSRLTRIEAELHARSPERMTPKEAAAYLGLSVQTLAHRRVSGIDSPRFLKVGSRIYYERDELRAYLERRRFAHTTEAQEKQYR